MSSDILNIPSPEWMHDPKRNCAIPAEFTAAETRATADMWHPTEGAEARYAKRLCDGCPVLRQCFLYAFNAPELEGIWGGTSTGQRAHLRTANRKAGNDAA